MYVQLKMEGKSKLVPLLFYGRRIVKGAPFTAPVELTCKTLALVCMLDRLPMTRLKKLFKHLKK